MTEFTSLAKLFTTTNVQTAGLVPVIVRIVFHGKLSDIKICEKISQKSPIMNEGMASDDVDHANKEKILIMIPVVFILNT